MTYQLTLLKAQRAANEKGLNMVIVHAPRESAEHKLPHPWQYCPEGAKEVLWPKGEAFEIVVPENS